MNGPLVTERHILIEMETGFTLHRPHSVQPSTRTVSSARVTMNLELLVEIQTRRQIRYSGMFIMTLTGPGHLPWKVLNRWALKFNVLYGAINVLTRWETAISKG